MHGAVVQLHVVVVVRLGRVHARMVTVVLGEALKLEIAALKTAHNVR